MRAADYVAVATFAARIETGPKEGQCYATCPICRGPISDGTIVHKLQPKRGGSHIYVHQECYP